MAAKTYREFAASIIDTLEALGLTHTIGGYKADLFLFKSAPLEQSIHARRQRVEYDSDSRASAILYSPEDVIVYKIKYYLMGSRKSTCATLAPF